jgi:hypothetical protein
MFLPNFIKVFVYLFPLQLLGFGVSLFAKASNVARAEIVYKGTGPLLVMIKNLALSMKQQ